MGAPSTRRHWTRVGRRTFSSWTNWRRPPRVAVSRRVISSSTSSWRRRRRLDVVGRSSRWSFCRLCRWLGPVARECRMVWMPDWGVLAVRMDRRLEWWRHDNNNNNTIVRHRTHNSPRIGCKSVRSRHSQIDNNTWTDFRHSTPVPMSGCGSCRWACRRTRLSRRQRCRPLATVVVVS